MASHRGVTLQYIVNVTHLLTFAASCFTTAIQRPSSSGVATTPVLTRWVRKQPRLLHTAVVCKRREGDNPVPLIQACNVLILEAVELGLTVVPTYVLVSLTC